MDEAIKSEYEGEKRNGRGDASSSTPRSPSRPEAAGKSPDVEATSGAQLVIQAGELPAQVARSAQALVRAELGKKTNKGATDLGDVAKALRQTSKDLEDNMVAPYVEKAAEQIDRASNFLRTADAKDVVSSVATFAKREPLIFLGSAFALGLLGARFAKSSSHGLEGASDERSTAGSHDASGGKRSSSPSAHGSAGRRS